MLIGWDGGDYKKKKKKVGWKSMTCSRGCYNQSSVSILSKYETLKKISEENFSNAYHLSNK